MPLYRKCLCWRICRDPLADVFWKLFNDIGWMGGFGMDVDRVVVLFLVGFVGICREVEGDIKEIDFFQVGLDCYV